MALIETSKRWEVALISAVVAAIVSALLAYGMNDEAQVVQQVGSNIVQYVPDDVSGTTVSPTNVQ